MIRMIKVRDIDSAPVPVWSVAINLLLVAFCVLQLLGNRSQLKLYLDLGKRGGLGGPLINLS